MALQDTTFEMERRRNRPEKYNREVVQKTVKAMEKIAEVLLQLFLVPCLGSCMPYQAQQDLH